MKIILMFLMFCIPTLSSALEYSQIETDYGTFNVRGNISFVSFYSPDNKFKSDSDLELDKSYAGINIDFVAEQYVTFRSYITTDGLNYGFFELSDSYDTTTLSLRAGRVNRLSTFFSGMGPHADNMNFLPQGTTTNRTGIAIFRFDGIQLAFNTFFWKRHNLSVELSYGKILLDQDDSGGLSGYSVHALFDPTRVKFESLHNDMYVPSIDIRYSYENFQLFADMFIANHTKGNLVIDYDIDNSILEYQLGLPPGTLPPGTTPIEQPVQVGYRDSYENNLMDIGMGYSFDAFEILFMGFQKYSKVGAKEAVPGTFIDYGITLMVRGNIAISTLMYGGFTGYNEDNGQEFLAKSGIVAPDWVGEGRGIFVGASHDFNEQFRIIGEVQFNKGGSFLHAAYQDPLTSKEYWNVISFSAHYFF